MALGTNLGILASVTSTPVFSNTYSLDFDGVDDYVEIPNITPRFGTQNPATPDSATNAPWSVSIWAYIPSGLTTTTPLFNIPLGNSVYSWKVIWGAGQIIQFGARYRTLRVDEVTTAINTNQWNHIVVTFDGVDTNALTSWKLFINGVNITNLTSSGHLGTNVTGKTYIAKDQSNYGEVKIDELSLYDIKLTDSNVTDIYNGGTPTDLTSLSPVAWYRIGDNGSWKSPQWLLPSNENKDKVSNYSFDFDGVDDYVNCGNISELNGVTRASWSIWSAKGDTTDDYLMSCYSSTSSLQQYLFHQYSDKLYIYLSNSGGTLRLMNRIDYTFNIDEWYHIGIVYNEAEVSNADKVKVYINGILQINQVAGFALTSLRVTTAITSIGRAVDFTTKEYGGKIDEVAIFNSAISIGDVWDGSGQPTDLSLLATPPVAWYRMGEEANFTSNWLVDNSALTNYSKRSFEFDGVDDYLSVSDNSIGQTQNISYSIWVNLDVTTRQYIIGNQNSSNGGCGLQIESGDVLVFQMADGTNDSFFNSRVASFSTYAPINTWNHILATWDGTDSKIYINGVLRNTWTPTLPYTISGYDTTFNIGWRAAGLSLMTNGKLDELALFDSAISIGDVWDGSGQPIDVSAVSGLTNNWRMGEDASFNGTNWTVPDNLGTSTGTSANMTVDSLVGEAANYSGGGISSAMTIEDRVGEAPSSSNNAISFNMESVDRTTDVPI